MRHKGARTMSKPDFEKMVHDKICMFVNGGPVVSGASAFNIAQDAFNAGLDRAAEIADEQRQAFFDPQYAIPQPIGSISERFACDQIINAIRAEREKS